MKPSWIVVIFSLTVGAWMAWDGTRALIWGDYTTPSRGEYAGQLGPWAHVLESVGCDPRSRLVKTLHVALGSFLAVSSVSLLRQTSWSWVAMLGASILVLWYFPFGTFAAIANIVLLLLPGMRRGKTHD